MPTRSLGNFANTGSVFNVETVVGNSGADTITIATQASNASIDLDGGADKLTFGDFVNRATVTGVETVDRRLCRRYDHLGGAASNASIDLGAGSRRAQSGQRVQHRHGLQC